MAIPVVLVRLVGGAVAGTLGGLALLHIYWAAGGTYGAKAAVPARPKSAGSWTRGAPLFKPGPLACLVVAALLLCAATLVTAHAFGLGWPRLTQLGGLGVALVFVARAVGDFRWVGFFKRHTGSRFAELDTILYAPLSLALGLGALLVALAS